MISFLFSILTAAILATAVYSFISKGRVDFKILFAVSLAIVTTYIIIYSGMLPLGRINDTFPSLGIGVGHSSIVEPPKNNSFIPESLQNLTNLSMMGTYQKTYQPYWQGEFG